MRKRKSIFYSRIAPILIGLLALKAFQATAQNGGVKSSSSEVTRFTVGAKAGLNLSQFSTIPSLTIGPNIGAYANYQVFEWLDAKIEIGYSKNGGGVNDFSTYADGVNQTPNSVGYYYLKSYINPIATFHNATATAIASLTLPEFEGQAIKPKLLVGVTYSYLLKEVTRAQVNYYATDNFTQPALLSGSKENETSRFYRNQFNALAGLGLDINTGKRIVAFDIRYSYGLTQLNQIRFADLSRAGSIYNNSVSVNLSMTILNFKTFLNN